MIQLYDWQEPSAEALTALLTGSTQNVALNASSTGTGKTYVALAVAKRLGVKPLIVCPKNVLTTWRTVAQDMGVEVLGVVNLEKLKTGRTPWVVQQGKDYRWTLEPGTMVILDECHKVSGRDTQNARLFAMAKVQNLKVLLMSATPFDSPLKMRALGFLLGLHSWNTNSFFKWCRAHGCYVSPFHNGLEFPKGKAGEVYLKKIRARIADKMVRLTVDDIPNFPENHVYAELFDLDKDYTDQINAIYETMADEIRNEKGASKLTVQLRARQKVELIKVPLLVDLAEDLLAEGTSVIIFVTFRDTVCQLQKLLMKHGCSVIIGDQTEAERETNRRMFQTDQHRICICTIASGGQSISLHQTEDSQYPRRTLITPNFSAVELVQALGRAARAGSRSKTVQMIVLIAGTIEEKVYRVVNAKLGNISTLVDDDLKGET